MKKIVITWIVCVLGIVILVAVAGRDITPYVKSLAKGESASPINGAFSLQNADGKTVTNKQLSGRYMLVYFGYTHCPDICPTSLLLMQNALSHLGTTAEKIQPIFITIDPARDTAKITQDYAAHFGKRMLGLSGTPEQIAATTENYKVYYSKVEDTRSALGYSVDHSGFIYLIGPKAEYITHFAYNASESELEEGLRQYVK